MDRHKLSCEVFFTWLENPFDRYWPYWVYCIGRFFDDPHNCGVVSDGPIEDNGSTAPPFPFYPGQVPLLRDLRLRFAPLKSKVDRCWQCLGQSQRRIEL